MTNTALEQIGNGTSTLMEHERELQIFVKEEHTSLKPLIVTPPRH